MAWKLEEKVAIEKYEKLKGYLGELGSVAVAYSSGVDSAFLLKVAHDVLGEKAIAITAVSAIFPKREKNEAHEFCEREQIQQIICEFDELSIDGFAKNPKNRCYICKKALFQKLKEMAKENQMKYVLEGSNMDDLGDYRPGLVAVEELDIVSPLRYVGLYKEEIRYLSHMLGLPTWEKPSFACLASRFVYGEQITTDKLNMVEQAEQFLLDLGFLQMRVRIHGTLARIEVLREDFDKIMEYEIRTKITKKLLELGFSYVTVDLVGFRSGSMNEEFFKKESQ